MTELLERLRHALQGKYTILREIGAGGMAEVFLATDLRHGRKVAVKVIRPEVERAQGDSRFAREIAIEATLQHPHIVPLYDSGDAGGHLYYVMPFVEGESLRDRLRREGQLPLDEALRIADQVASALSYAHAAGVVHRDIKPENILLSGGDALVADFGIARAASPTGAGTLTATGVALGTPAYMSPEQAAGSATLDARTDLYALGCVLYEMLAGEPPFTGPTVQAILARHSVGVVPSLRVVRPSVPRYVEAAVLRALEKVPADRFRSTAQFADALRRPPLLGFRVPRLVSPWRWVLATGGGALVLLAAWTLGVRFRPAGAQRGTHLDTTLVAVAPFQVSGTVDRTLVTPEAVEELLYTRLNGEGGIKALYPGAVTAAWRRTAKVPAGAMTMQDALRAAASLGAGRLLWGSVFGTTARLAFSASMVDVASGALVVGVGEVAGRPDSVLQLLDQLAGGILLRAAGERARRVSELTTDNVAALRAYLAGRERYRRGRYEDAAAGFAEALQLDSTFVLAAMALVQAEEMLGERGYTSDALPVAWAQRHRLSPRDSLYLLALVGSRYPASTPHAEELRQWERVVRLEPDRWEASFYLGDILFQGGPVLGIADWRQRAAAAFRQTLAGDSCFAPALEHLVNLSLAMGDTAEARRVGIRYLSVNSAGERADFVRWRLGLGLGDAKMLADARQRMRSESSVPLSLVLEYAQLDGLGLEDAAVAAAELRRRARGAVEVFMADFAARDLALNRGRPGDAPPLTGEGQRDAAFVPFERVVEALYWDGDSASAAVAVGGLSRLAERARTATLTDPSPFTALCTRGLWQTAHGDLRLARDAIDRLRSLRSAGDEAVTAYIPICAAVLDAQVAMAQRRPNADVVLARLDSLLRTGPITSPEILLAASVTAARLYEARGDLASALAAVRRHANSPDAWGTTGLSTYLREEGRLAALVGDTAAAIRAYHHYLALRSDPEPRLAPQAMRVRAALNALERSSSDAASRRGGAGS